MSKVGDYVIHKKNLYGSVTEEDKEKAPFVVDKIAFVFRKQEPVTMTFEPGEFYLNTDLIKELCGTK